MTAKLWGSDDKLSTSGGTMSGTIVLQGTPPFTVVNNLYAGKVTLNGTTAVVVSTTAVDTDSLILLTVQPSTAPQGTPWVSTVTAGTSFSVKSTSNSDTAVVLAWFIVEHS